MRKRLLLIGGLAVAGVLTAGGVAYAVAGDSPNPETRYVQVVEGDSAPELSGPASADREDCPEKNGTENNSGTTEQL